MEPSFFRQGNVTIVMPGTRLTALNVPDLETLLLDRIAAEETAIVLDFSQTLFIASAGLRALLRAAKEAENNGGRLVLCNCSGPVAKVLEITGFDQLITCYPSGSEAVSALTA
ncbi:MAG: STAS domain-containing protein [Pseudomonadota bacterium]